MHIKEKNQVNRIVLLSVGSEEQSVMASYSI